MGEAFITRRGGLPDNLQHSVEIIPGIDCFTEDFHYGGDSINPQGGYIADLDLAKNDYIFFVATLGSSNFFHTYYLKRGILVDECHAGNSIITKPDEYITFTIESNERVSFSTNRGHIRDQYISMVKL